MPEQSVQTPYAAEDGQELLDESGDVLVLDVGASLPANYQFVRVGDGISTGEKIR
jgi:hypothetical protein